MKIAGLDIYQVNLPLHEGSYNWSDGKSVEVFDSTVIRLKTDEGIEGYGEVCPLGPFYLPSYPEGARTGIQTMSKGLIGLDPTQINKMHGDMERLIKGHPYVKSAIDMACWDILGKLSGVPVYTLLGGKQTDDVILYRAISQESPEQMAAKIAGYQSEGYTKFQLKVGGKPDDDIDRIIATSELMRPGDVLVADANTGWLKHEAIRVVRAVKDIDVYIEQPCLTYEECLDVRRNTNHPFVLDESIYNVQELIRGFQDGAMDVINIKISKVGGLYNARLMRDICQSLGIAMTIEDSWGSDIITSAIAHLAQSTTREFQFSATDFNSYVTVDTAANAPKRENGRMKASGLPGLGIEPDHSKLGDPVFSI